MSSTDKTENIWHLLRKDGPIVGLAPMDGVTDLPYRFIQKKYGGPDLIFTEFTSVEGVCHGADRLLRDLIFEESQRPIIAQIYGTTPRFFRQTAIACCQLGFDGVDINMGCPSKSVSSGGAGAGLIKTPKLAQEIIREVALGIAEWSNGVEVKDCPDLSKSIIEQIEIRHKKLPKKYQLKKEIPISVKTRIGLNSNIVNDWISALLETNPVAITVHGRTLKQGYSGQADWSAIQQAVELGKSSQTLVLGNGDVTSKKQALEKAQQHKVDGVLIGRASFGNPGVFLENRGVKLNLPKIALEHSQVYEATYQTDPKYSFLPMRKHLSWYIKGVKQAKEIRIELMKTNSSSEVEQILNKYHLL